CGPDLIEPGATGATFPFGDVTGLVRAIDDVLAFDRKRTQRHLAARIALYSPTRAAEAIVEAATTLAIGGPLQ
ncbi:MAG TPA: hypothetical protein VJ777_04190, partial [Mycobacterium sp.]|nr:hypothetical protein [Mycobacterium sp.]